MEPFTLVELVIALIALMIVARMLFGVGFRATQDLQGFDVRIRAVEEFKVRFDKILAESMTGKEKIDATKNR